MEILLLLIARLDRPPLRPGRVVAKLSEWRSAVPLRQVFTRSMILVSLECRRRNRAVTSSLILKMEQVVSDRASDIGEGISEDSIVSL